jgi:hypothetical protein
MVTFTFRHTIDKFLGLKRRVVSSPNTKCGDFLWALDVYPNEQDLGYVGIYLTRYGIGDGDGIPDVLEVTFEISLVDKNGNRKTSRKHTIQFHSGNNSWGFCDMFKRKDLKRNRCLLLPGGSLTVSCSILFPKSPGNGHQLEPQAIVDRLESAFDSSLFTDFTIHVEGQQIKTHKMVLASGSPVFRTMFSPETLESLNNEVTVNGMGYHVMQALVAFLYTGRVKCGVHSMDLMRAADYYQVQELMSICEKSLALEVNENNAVTLLMGSDPVGSSVLHKVASKFIAKNKEKVFRTKEWKKMLRESHQLVQTVMSHMVYKG